MSYIDAFVIPVPADNRAAYQAMAEKTAQIFLECGALSVVECWGDDLQKGEVTDFFKAVSTVPSENVVVSWIVWPSKEARVAGNAKFMADPRMQESADPSQPGSQPMPFDGKRLIMGGFTTMVDVQAG